MEEINLKHSKSMEEFYIGIQLFTLLILSIMTSFITGAENFVYMIALTLSYAIYVFTTFYNTIIKKIILNIQLDYRPKIYTSLLDGIFIALFIYVNSKYIHAFDDLLYVFVVLQSIRYNDEKNYFFSTYAALLHITLLVIINNDNIISTTLFIHLSLYFILNFLICSILKQINHLENQRRFFQNEIIQKNRVLQQIAYKDYLTDMSNHQSFYLYFDELTKLSTKCNSFVSLALIDIDNFKQINDTYGHLSGDKILRELSSILKNNIRHSDFSARYGGEEFAILFPDTHLDSAITLAEQIRKAVESYDFLIEDKVIKITISLGVGSYIPSWTCTKQYNFIDEVDKLLYQAKNSGKNNVKYKNLYNITKDRDTLYVRE